MNGNSPGIGRDFVEELDTVYERLADSPYAYQDIFNGVWRAILRRFPYAVFYLSPSLHSKESHQILVASQLNVRPHPRKHKCPRTTKADANAGPSDIPAQWIQS